MIRPEDVTLAGPDASASSAQLAWPGRIVDGVFRGPRRSLVVETAGMGFNVECPATRSMAVGETTTLLVDTDKAWALPLQRANSRVWERVNGTIAGGGCRKAGGERLRAPFPRGFRARPASHRGLSDVRERPDLERCRPGRPTCPSPACAARSILSPASAWPRATARHLPPDAAHHGAGFGLSRLQHGVDHRPAGL